MPGPEIRRDGIDVSVASNALIRMRYWQLVACAVATMSVSSPQYVWTLLVGPLRQDLGVGLPIVQVTFAVLIIVQCGLGPVHGWLADRFGPRLMVSVGALLVGVSWISSAYVTNIYALYFTYGIIGGFGIGIVYVAAVGLIGKWFPDRRGFAIGMVAAGYGIGAVVTTGPVAASINAFGHKTTLVLFGFLCMGACLLVAQFLRVPDARAISAKFMADQPIAKQDVPDVRWTAMLRTPIYWLLFVMMVMMSSGGLMAISQMGPLAEDLGVHNAVVFGFAALPLALTFDRICNGLTRPFFGWLSDMLGRELTMTLAFVLEGVSILALLKFGTDPVLFVILSGLVFFAWGEIFSLFPAILGDLFGNKHASTNYGFLLMAQGVGSILGGPLAALLRENSSDWATVFYVVIALDLLTAALACILLLPMRKRFLQRARQSVLADGWRRDAAPSTP